jgi:hypothetical protein
LAKDRVKIIGNPSGTDNTTIKNACKKSETSLEKPL